MASIGLPVPLVLLLRRLFNAISAFSMSQSYLISRWAASSGTHDVEPDPGGFSEEQTSSFQVKSSWDLLKALRRIPWSKGLPKSPWLGWQQGIIGKVDNQGLRVLHTTASSARPRTTATDRPSQIHRLINHPTLFDPVRIPRLPIVLCHGLYGFDVRGPETFPKLRMHYWSNVLHVLRKKVGAEVVVTGVPGTGSIASRAERMDRFLRERVKHREINFLAHSMGGLDCRHLITHINPRDYTPLSLTSLSVPHRGSPFMDWCLANIGIGFPRPFPFPSSPAPPPDSSYSSSVSLPYSLKSPLLARPSQPLDGNMSPLFKLGRLPSNFAAMILSLIDSPAYANLTTSFLCDRFNPSTPNKTGVKYLSVSARTTQMSIWHPLWLPKLIVDAAEEHWAAAVDSQGSPDVTVSYSEMNIPRDRDRERGNDGLVTVSSAKWGEHLGTMEGCDHWEMRGARGLGAEWDEGLGKAWREWVGTWTERECEVGERESIPPPRAEGDHKQKDWVTRNDLASRFDLERFYVALSRKLYDEGL